MGPFDCVQILQGESMVQWTKKLLRYLKTIVSFYQTSKSNNKVLFKLIFFP